jgi:hypothetical protein
MGMFFIKYRMTCNYRLEEQVSAIITCPQNNTHHTTMFAGTNTIEAYFFTICSMIINDVSDYINLLVRIAHIICNDSL